MTDQTITEREALIRRLGVVAALLQKHPDIPMPSVGIYGVYWHLYSWEHKNVPATAALIRKHIGGKWDKEASDYSDDFSFVRGEYKISVKREQVCTRRVVRTETVTLPPVAARPETTVEREIVEWDCEPLLSKASA